MADRKSAIKTSGAASGATERSGGSAASAGKPRGKRLASVEVEAKPLETVDSYLAKLGSPQREIVEKLRRVVREAAPKAVECIKWGRPVYELSGLLCSISAHATHVNFGFFTAGCMLPDPDHLLEGTGENMRHLKVRTLSEIRGGLLTVWLRMAVEFNEDV